MECPVLSATQQVR